MSQYEWLRDFSDSMRGKEERAVRRACEEWTQVGRSSELKVQRSSDGSVIQLGARRYSERAGDLSPIV